MNKAAWLVIGTIITVLAIGVGAVAIWLASSRGPQQTELQQHVEQRIPDKVIFVDFEASDITVDGGDFEQVLIDRTLTWDRVKPRFTETWSGSTLRISHDCQDNSVLQHCAVDYRLQLPAKVDVEVETASGDVSVSGTTGRIKLNVISGDTTVRAEQAVSIDVRAVSGDVTIGGGATGAKVETVSGEIQLDFAAAPAAVTARSTSGDVTVRVPSPADSYRISITSVSGDQDVSLPAAPTGDRLISVETVSGDIRVS